MAIPGMDDYPIKLGTLLFTMVEPEKGQYDAQRRGLARPLPQGGAAVRVSHRPVLFVPG